MDYHPIQSGKDWPLFVAELTKGKVVGDLRLVATSGNEVLGDVQALAGEASPAEHWTVKRRRLRRTIQITGRAITVGASTGSNFYHWMFDSLPRLDLLRQAGIELSSDDTVIINEQPQPFQAQSLLLLGIPKARLARARRSAVTKVEKLIVPSAPAPRGTYPGWVCQFLRRSFLTGLEAGSGNRIFISRSGALHRKITNEAAVQARLERLGFRTVRLETMDFKTQVSLFARASLVVAPHGAGLSHLVFCPPKAGVIELFSPCHVDPCYENLAEAVGLQYTKLVGDVAGEVPEKHLDEADMEIDITILNQALKKMGL